MVRELNPKYVIGENVNGILSTIHESVCTDLETEGYEVRTYSIPACAVGAHHERYRVCILGISKGKSRLQAYQKTDTAGTQWKTRQTLCSSLGIICPERIGQYINPQFAEWMMGFPIGWGDTRNTKNGCSATEMQ